MNDRTLQSAIKICSSRLSVLCIMSEKQVKKKESDNKLGYFGCTSYVVGNVVGSGIFITPSTVIRYAGSAGLSLAIWFACAILSLIGGFVYIELGTSIRKAGGDFGYCCFFEWHGVAFCFMFVGVAMTYPVSVAIQAQTFGQYLMDGVTPFYAIDTQYTAIIERLIGIVLIVLIGWINFYSLGSFVAKFQIIATISKVASMMLIVFGGLYYLFIKGKTENIENLMDGSNYEVVNISLGFYAGFFSYVGWDVLNYGIDEIRNPKKVLKVSLISGISIIALLYILMNFSYFIVLSAKEAKETNAIGALFSKEAFGKFSFAIPFLIALLLCGTLNSNLYVATRFVHAAAMEGHLPSFLRYIHSTNNSPRASIFLQTLLSIFYTLFRVDRLIEYVTLLIILQKIATLIGFLLMRYRKTPVDPNAIRFPIIFSIIFLFTSIILVVVPISNYWNIVFNLSFLLIGLIMYLIFIKYRLLSVHLRRIDELFGKFFARLLNSKLDARSIDLKPPSEQVNVICERF